MPEDKELKDAVAKLSKQVLGYELQFDDESLSNMTPGRHLKFSEVLQLAKAEVPLWIVIKSLEGGSDYNGPVQSYYDEDENTLLFNVGCMGMELSLDEVESPLKPDDLFDVEDESDHWLIYATEQK